MSFTVRESLLLVMTMPQEWLLALCANKMFDVPVFTQCCYNAFFNRASARSTDRYPHLIMAPQTVEFVLQERQTVVFQGYSSRYNRLTQFHYI